MNTVSWFVTVLKILKMKTYELLVFVIFFPLLVNFPHNLKDIHFILVRDPWLISLII